MWNHSSRQRSVVNLSPGNRLPSGWSGVGSSLRDRLAAVGLVEAPKRALLSEFLQGFILSRPDVKPATLEVWQQLLPEPDRVLRGHTAPTSNHDRRRRPVPGVVAYAGNLAPATVAKRLSFARTFLHVARKHKLIDENPFAEVKIPTANVSVRQRFIDRDAIQKLLGAANPTWRTIVALARFGGLRCPSEVLSLEWRHVDWERARLTVPSPKTDCVTA